MSDSESNSNYKSKQNNNPNLLNEYVIYCFPNDSIINNISNNIIINEWNFISCSTDYDERKAYLYINPESESSTQITLFRFFMIIMNMKMIILELMNIIFPSNQIRERIFY